MKLDKTQCVEMLQALGFTKADTWDDEKLKDRIGKVPQKVKEDEVPEEFEDLYSTIANSDPDDPIQWVGERGKPKKAAKKKAAKKKVAKKKVVPPTKPKRVAKKKVAKPTATPKPPIEKDEYGSRVGSISARVNAAIGEDWVSREDIAEACGITVEQADNRLYYCVQEGWAEKETLTRYRLKSKKGKGKK